LNILKTILESIKCIDFLKILFSPKGDLKIIIIRSVWGARPGACGGMSRWHNFSWVGECNMFDAHCIEIKYRNMVIISFSPLTCVNQKPPKSTWIFEFLIVNFDCLSYLISWRVLKKKD
jgi:hypothetical protein